MRITHALPPLVHRASLLLTLGLFALLALFGTQLPSATAQSPSFVRVIHASPFVGTADVFVDGTLLLSSFAFGAVTDYVPLPPGPHKVQIALVGKGIGAAALSRLSGPRLHSSGNRSNTSEPIAGSVCGRQYPHY